MHRKGQGAFEYILMLAGILLIVILIVLILQGSIRTSNTQLSGSQTQYNQQVALQRYVPDSQSNLSVRMATGSIPVVQTWVNSSTGGTPGSGNTVVIFTNSFPCCANCNLTGPNCCGISLNLTACRSNVVNEQFNNSAPEGPKYVGSYPNCASRRFDTTGQVCATA